MGGVGGGVGGGPPPGRQNGRRRAHFHRGGAPRPAPGRLGRPDGGRWLGGGGVSSVAAEPPRPECYSPPAAAARRIPGPREPDTRRRALPHRGGGRAAPPTARPLSCPSRGFSLSRSRPVWGGSPGWGGADCPQCAPGVVAPSGPGGSLRSRRPPVFLTGRGAEAERTGSAAMSATHPTRLETRTKESNACASQGLARKPPWRNEGEGPRPGARGGIPRPLQSAEGAPPARLARRVGEVEHERTR